MAEAPVADQTIYIARPTVRISEQAYPLVSELMLGMRMTESEGGLSALELRPAVDLAEPALFCSCADGAGALSARDSFRRPDSMCLR